MRTFVSLAAALLLAAAAVGCGGDGAKGINKDKDKPRPADKEAGKTSRLGHPADATSIVRGVGQGGRFEPCS